MRKLRAFLLRLGGLFHKNRKDRELAEELDCHVQIHVQDNLRTGMNPDEARREALLMLGGIEATKEAYRDRRSLPWLENLGRDLGYATRTLRKNPGFAAAAIVTLALGIGANAAIFSVVYAVLVKPLPYSDPEQISSVEVVIPELRNQFASLPVRIQDYLQWRKASTAFSEIVALQPAEWNVTGDGEPERLSGARVSANFFSFLGVPLTYGREFAPEEEQAGRDKVVVISEAMWRRRYGGDPSVMGRSINLNGENHLVVGIAPPSLLVPTGKLLHPVLPFGPRIDVWKPIAPTSSELQGENWNYGLLVRLRPGESAERGRQQLQAMLNASIRSVVPDAKTLFTQLVPIRELYAGKVRLRLLLVLGASGLLLVIACVNIASLFLARVASRATEFATRIALGAGRARIVGQMLTETTLIAIIGGVVGAVIAYFGVSVLVAYGPAEVPLLAETRTSLPMLLFAAAMSLSTGFACGIIPAWQAYRKDAAAGLQEGAKTSFGGNRAARFRQVLVGVEMALGTALLGSAGLLFHSFVKVMHAPRGYEVERVLAVDLALSGQRYGGSAQQAAFYRELTERIRVLPSVLAAGAISDLPALGASGTQAIFYATDTEFPGLALQRPIAGFRSATPGYFAASGTALRAGRFFAEQEQVPVALISESLARRLWPGEALMTIVGRAVRQGDGTGPLITVVGIVSDVSAGAVDRELPPQIYHPHHQRPTGSMTIVVRTAQEPAALAATLRAEIRKMDPKLPIPNIRAMREIVSTSVEQRRFHMVLTSLCAVVALVLGAVGIYGVVSYSVACRTPEIGLRVALGALPRDVMRWVFSSGLQPVLIGLGIGLGGAIVLAGALRSLLFGITPADPISLGTVAGILLLTSGLACYLPARRAAKIDPMVALRYE